MSRGITTIKDADLFLNGTWKDLHNPFLFHHMEKACTRLKHAIANKERVVIYGDFDSDGVTATAILVLLLRDLDAKVSWYIPDRFGEGHGLSDQGIDWIIKNKGDVVITVDCGIANPGQVNSLVKAGIDVIITDHHHPEESTIPKQALILHPALGEYPFPNLTGAGMAFKLAQGLLQLTGHPPEQCLNYIDLAAIGIVADVAPLLGENRLIVREGLNQMERALRPSLLALVQRVNNRRSPIGEGWSAKDLAFLIAPKINAAGRMEKASWALSLLLEKDPVLIDLYAERLEKLNQERQAIEEEILKEINKTLEDFPAVLDEPLLLLHEHHWHFGIIGIIASRLANRYNMPVFLACNVDGIIKGSARAPKGFSIVEALDSCSDTLLRHGGHAEAGGFTLEPKQFSHFKEALFSYAHVNPLPSITKTAPATNIDFTLATPELAQELMRLAPFGQGNPIHLFSSNDIVIHQQRLVGKSKNHLLLSLYNNGSLRKGLLFNWEGDFPLPTGRYTTEYQLALDHWQMKREEETSNNRPVVLYISKLTPQISNVKTPQVPKPAPLEERSISGFQESKIVLWLHKQSNAKELATTYFFVDQRYLKSKSQYMGNLLSRYETLLLMESLEDLKRIAASQSVSSPLHAALPILPIEREFHPLPEEDLSFGFSVKEGERRVEHLLLWFMPTDLDEMRRVLTLGRQDRSVKIHLLFSDEHLVEKRGQVKGTSKEKSFQQLEKLLFKDKILRAGGSWFGDSQQ